MVGTDVYKPLELFALQPSGGGKSTWTFDETKVHCASSGSCGCSRGPRRFYHPRPQVHDRQLLTPVGGAYDVRGSKGVNALIYWCAALRRPETNCAPP